MRRICFLLLIMTVFAGCARGSRSSALGQTKPAAPARDAASYWDGDGVSGPSSVKIDLGEQLAYFYKSGQLVGVSRVSTGREGYRTPTGRFAVLDKNIDHVSSIYGSFVDADGSVVQKDVGVRTHQPPPGARFRGAPMPYFVRFHGGIGMHAGYLPGYPASHGCVRLPKVMAANFFNNVHVGTPVEVAN